jgi:hypothetical protein
MVKANLRRQALQWLKSELTDTVQDPRIRPAIAQTLRYRRKDPDLPAVRDSDALAKRPDVERKEWLALWDKVDPLLREAGEPESEFQVRIPQEWQQMAVGGRFFGGLFCHLARPRGDPERGLFWDGPR